MIDLREKVPNIAALTVQLGKTYSHIHAVLRGDVQAGPTLAIAIEEATKGEISRSDLRPDLWPHASSSLDTAV